MAAMKVHGNPLSTSTQRVLACLYEKDVEFQFVNVDMGAGQHKSETFLSLNPFGQVPAFEQGDLKLFESRAITQYISQEYTDKGTQLLLPDSNKTMAVLQLWKEVEAHHFDSPSTKLVFELHYKPIFGMATDTEVVEENEGALAKVLDVYEARLAESKYLACDNFTLVDLHHLPNVHYLMGSSAKKLFDSRPHVSAWVADITARSAWSKVLEMQKL
ncbi:glutathione S-transferase phi 8, Arabidopsis thaliana glutathione S-transferase phi 8 [Hibiscus trionum]|uniref:glutathione transferase n=1 Tax=Hibiscus trionum TaxID=183268 RepID=A0A9W7HZE5_HIBTR|nr:glutathione S-transferase phi 8, Arabidopsis thaliana glutathione S-transferase phi 8 [Hibiscus trionum]